jgi:hypothetical protein
MLPVSESHTYNLALFFATPSTVCASSDKRAGFVGMTREKKREKREEIVNADMLRRLHAGRCENKGTDGRVALFFSLSLPLACNLSDGEDKGREERSWDY